MAKSKSSYFLYGMILLSLALGIFVSYLLLFANALFISEIGTDQLPMAYLISGIGGLLITWVFNSSEKKWGFAKASTFFSLFIAILIFLIWYAYVQDFYTYYVVFFAYAMYWISVNFTGLVFWKIPSYIFNLEENKKYSGIISSGEGISAIISYLSVPVLLSLDFFTRDKFLLISFFGILSFAGITFLLSKGIVVQAAPQKTSETKESTPSHQKQLIKEPYFKLIFISILLGVVIQLVIDFSLMEVSANQMSDPLVLAKYFSFIFGGMRVLELVLKSFFSKYLIKEYGVFISLTTLIFALGFTTIIGISSYFIGYLGLVLIVASLSKVFERSLYRSFYAPTINLLYQAYPLEKRSLTQNYADGFGKTFAQFIAAILIFCISLIESFEYKVLVLLILILVILVIWLVVSKRLVYFYRLELSNVLQTLTGATVLQKETETVDLKERSYLTKENTLVVDQVEQAMNTISKFLSIEKNQNTHHSGTSTEVIKYPSEDDAKAFVTETQELITLVASCSPLQLQKIFDWVLHLKQDQNSSRLLDLIELLLHTSTIQKNTNFNFYTSQRKLRIADFLYTAVIQHLVKKQVQDLEKQEYYQLLEERIQKYTFLLVCHKELGKAYPVLGKLLLAETKAAMNDILFCLSFNHDPVALNQILTMINQGDKSQELISLELLELILEEQEKKWVLPIFKESNPDKILNKLASDFPQVVLGLEKRLLSLLISHNLDVPKLIKSHALFALHLDFPSKQNEDLFNSIKKSNLKLFQLTEKMIEGANIRNLPNLEQTELYTGQELQEDLTGYESAEEISSLHYSYWLDNTEMKEKQSVAEKALHSVYKTLFPAVFPMEKLN
jgi:ATP:ADP antiporter, AAA family